MAFAGNTTYHLYESIKKKKKKDGSKRRAHAEIITGGKQLFDVFDH